jgi:diketogulonate reductase-like aldo/keto reductase
LPDLLTSDASRHDGQDLRTQQWPAHASRRIRYPATPPSFQQLNREDPANIFAGTWKAEPGKVKEAVVHALKSGYRLIDCAYCYGNEDEVGEGLKEAFASGIKREDVMIMTKAWATYNTRLELALEKSLKSLGLEYIDMFLIVSLRRGLDYTCLTDMSSALARPRQP